MNDFPDDIQLDDEPFEPFDDYENFADEMMEQAERGGQQQQMVSQPPQQQQQQRSSSVLQPLSSSFASTRDAGHELGDLPPQRDFLNMIHSQAEQIEREVEQSRVQSQQQRGAAAAAATAGGNRTNQGAAAARKGWNRPIGSNAGGAGAGEVPAEGDLAAVNVVKKRPKQVRLDAEKLLGNDGYRALMTQGKRFKISKKARTSAEKDINTKKNLSDLMRLLQTWGHVVFPKATLWDFLHMAESKTKTDKQLKVHMNQWRDTFWDEAKEKEYASNETEHAEKEAEDRQNGVWEAHAAERGQGGSTEDMDQDPFLVPQRDDGQPSSSNWSFGNEGSTVTTTSGSKPSQRQQPRPRPAASRKGKERLVDDPSAAMRLQVSGDEEDGGDQDDYEVALSRMRDSMNLNSPVNQRRLTNRTQVQQQRRQSGVEAMEEDHQESSSRISSSGMGRAGSFLDEDEEDDDDAPLFPHRTLQMMGGLSALREKEKQAAESSSRSSSIPGKKTPTPAGSTQRATLSSDEDDDDRTNTLDQTNASPMKFSLGSDWGNGGGSMFAEFENGGAVKGEPGLNLNDDDEDEDVVVSQRRSKARKGIILEDSDDE
ncbi:hypothetical protein BGX23_010248 [Mortierella sp. AD031]|nr:hypothetical protein BGX23_010248 [Mortierella sp. AD031]KAG0201671.1 hypothetical protein BGX33_010166 [Mortierella sp. NVP41]